MCTERWEETMAADSIGDAIPLATPLAADSVVPRLCVNGKPSIILQLFEIECRYVLDTNRSATPPPRNKIRNSAVNRKRKIISNLHTVHDGAMTHRMSQHELSLVADLPLGPLDPHLGA